MFDPINSSYSKGYCLSFNDDTKWWITGIGTAISRVNELTYIMNLKECSYNNTPKLIFIESEDFQTNDNDLILSNNGWYQYSYWNVNIWYHTSCPNVLCEFIDQKNKETENFSPEYMALWFSLQPIYRQNIKNKGLPFHSALLELDGLGILLAGIGNIGKSTCCNRVPKPWKALCDDESLIVLTKDNKYFVHPLPTWSDYISNRARNSWDVQYSVPLSAIFFLEQYPEDEVIKIDAVESSMKITQSSAQVWAKFRQKDKGWKQIDYFRDTFNNAVEIAKQIPAYRLRVSLTGKFWEEIEKVI
ncbi:TPA: SynChlorMet cassette protein ScmC [bacterium]|nr:SynChlorMet cassette protein ScmC [bacterium]